jgi:Ca2+-binding RTX toxin-like protein
MITRRAPMNIQSNFGRTLGLAAAATMAAGLVGVGGSADAASSAQASASVANNTLTITGTDGNDSISVSFVENRANTVLVDFGNGSTETFDRSTFNAASVFLGRGDDQFRTLSGGSAVTDPPLNVFAGDGDDSILGGAGNDTLSGGSGRDDLRGGGGLDVLVGNGGDDVVDGGVGTDTEILGTGADTALWVPGEGSDVITGGTGHDTLAFTGADVNEIMSLSANGDNAVFLRDLGNIRMDLDGVENVDVAALGGADVVTVNNLEGTDVRHADIDLAAQGGAADGQQDKVVVNGTDAADHIDVRAHDGAVDVAGLRARTAISGGEPTDQLQVLSQGGNDRVRVGEDALALIGVGVDLGTGQR